MVSPLSAFEQAIRGVARVHWRRGDNRHQEVLAEPGGRARAAIAGTFCQMQGRSKLLNRQLPPELVPLLIGETVKREIGK